MAALVYPLAQDRTSARPRLVLVGRDRATGRPVTGARPSATVYRRRRAVTLAVLALAAVAAVVGLAQRGALAGFGGGPLTATGPSGAGPAGVVTLQPAAAHVHVVQPGDTVWSIVRGTRISGDPRPVVDRIEGELGGRPLQIGQRLVLP